MRHKKIKRTPTAPKHPKRDNAVDGNTLEQLMEGVTWFLEQGAILLPTDPWVCPGCNTKAPSNFGIMGVWVRNEWEDVVYFLCGNCTSIQQSATEIQKKQLTATIEEWITEYLDMGGVVYRKPK